LGDNHESWHNKYAVDDWGRIQYHDVVIPATGDGPERIEKRPVLNPMWDPKMEYVPRRLRKEWAPIGLFGKLLVRDDGTCIPGMYCKPMGGIATSSVSGLRVMKRLSPNIVMVFIK